MTYSTAELPTHLRQYIAEQDYNLYTPIDHASWRYIMRVSKEFFKEHAHPKYLEGLRETGVTVDRIPKISEMDQKLQRFGWRAVIITGFIPPEPFLELLAHRILPIASDMRKLENIDYTPAPDIVHEAAGHAPILADPAYSSYLKKFGEIARKVIFAKEDNDLYEAVLHLSETKEDPASTDNDIELAQQKLNKAVENVGYVSEAQQVTRLGWWSTEYGLFEKNGKYLIYGAGLLSSVGESFNCLNDSVQKVPLTVDCIETAYDITKPQPQLFVTDDFKKLESVIDQLSEKMAYKHGGIKGLEKAKRAGTLTTTQLENGLQISGILNDFRTINEKTVSFVKYSQPVQISFGDVQLSGHGPDAHSHGFSSPLGRIKNCDKAPSDFTLEDWNQLGCKEGQTCSFEYESGIRVEGLWVRSLIKEGRYLLLTFKDCKVTDTHIKSGQEVLFDPSWGLFDLAIGEKITSVFGGAADRNAYALHVQQKEFKPRPQKCNLTSDNKELNNLYGVVRELRDKTSESLKSLDHKEIDLLKEVLFKLNQFYPNDWLLRLEILELLKLKAPQEDLAVKQLQNDLQKISKDSDRLEMLIQRGLSLKREFGC